MKGRTSMKARLGIATAVLVGGGAIGVAAVATGNHSTPTTARSSAFGYTLNFHHTMSEGAALSAALSQWASSHQKAMTTLAQMQPMRTFAQTTWHHHTIFAAQRGTVMLATKRFLLVQSSNKALHLWWLRGTAFANVSNNATGGTRVNGVVKGDLVLVAGERVRGQLIAKLVLFATSATAVTPTPSATVSTTPTVTTTPTVIPSVTPSGVSGTHS